MNTIPEQGVDGRRRRRLHSDEFKADVVASCQQPGVSMAAVAMAHGLNANLLRRWVREAEIRPRADLAERPLALKPPRQPQPQEQPQLTAFPPAAFVPLALPATSRVPDIRIELRRGATSVTVTWPADAAAECAAWMRELLK